MLAIAAVDPQNRITQARALVRITFSFAQRGKDGLAGAPHRNQRGADNSSRSSDVWPGTVPEPGRSASSFPGEGRGPVAVRVRRFARVYRNWAPASAGEPAVEMLDFACLNQRARPRGPLFEPSNRRGMTPGPSNKRRDFSGDKVTNDADVRDLIGRSQQPGVRSTLSPLAPGGAVSDRPAPRRPSPLPPARRESRRKGHAARRCGFRWHCLRGRSSRPESGSSWSA